MKRYFLGLMMTTLVSNAISASHKKIDESKRALDVTQLSMTVGKDMLKAEVIKGTKMPVYFKKNQCLIYGGVLTSDDQDILVKNNKLESFDVRSEQDGKNLIWTASFISIKFLKKDMRDQPGPSNIKNVACVIKNTTSLKEIEKRLEGFVRFYEP
jgi:hypothetical protein